MHRTPKHLSVKAKSVGMNTPIIAVLRGGNEDQLPQWIYLLGKWEHWDCMGLYLADIDAKDSFYKMRDCGVYFLKKTNIIVYACWHFITAIHEGRSPIINSGAGGEWETCTLPTHTRAPPRHLALPTLLKLGYMLLSFSGAKEASQWLSDSPEQYK